MGMKRLSLLLAVLTAFPCLAADLPTAIRSVIPSQVQQIINVDYRRMRGSEAAMAMKTKLLPPNMKQFEDALKGVVPERDIDQITLVSFRNKDNALQMIGIAQGTFPQKTVNLRLSKQKIKGSKVEGATLYPMPGGMQMTFLDDWTMLFGDQSAVEAALEARDGSGKSLNNNAEVADLIASVDQGTVWSVLDTAGTQTMMKSALGTAADLAEYDSVKKRLMGSRYSMDFGSGVDFNLSVQTSDNVTASTLSSILKAGLMFKKASANATEKAAIDNTTVDSDSSRLVVHFKADDKSFQQLLESPMFASVVR